MITENELQISNMSYTDKDFQRIYPELLDLTKKLTNKWDPSISNESDPGLVLIKLLAAVGDKLNYNIDKNVLECFMPSATQETSMRMLTDAVGYNMKYYQAATTDITFKYTDTITTAITFPKFSTVVSNADSSIAYTLIQDVILSERNIANSGVAIEGSLETLVVGGSEIIKLENLTDNNRLYFPDIYVAENGVFITNNGVANFTDWKKVDNLNVQQPLTRCYKFSYDSSRELPYIEFPSDIAQLIGSGLIVGYIVTSGVNGNTAAGTLTQLQTVNDIINNTDGYTIDKLIIFNSASATTGRDKETINEAYNNFKKIIGTFETLVTTRDYANAIYNLYDEYNKPLVSNAAVADRTNDFNSAVKIVSYDTNGQYVALAENRDLSVSNLVLYPLKPYRGENYSIYNPSAVYNESYLPLKAPVTSEYEYVDDLLITTDLDELKCIGHTFKRIYRPDSINNYVYTFKNVTSLDAQIFTYAKVNAAAQAEIRNNVIKALSDNFNARKVDYGYAIPYDDILDVMYVADSRIKSINLSEPEYTPYFVDINNDEERLETNPDVASTLVAKNVLAGKLSLFKYDDRFEWRFGQTDDLVYDNLTSISTNLTIPIAANQGENGFEYTLASNEVIQLIAPNLSTDKIYPMSVYFRFSGQTNPAPIINANTNYELLQDEQIDIYYINSNNETITETLTAGTIVCPTFEMTYTDSGSMSTYPINGSNNSYNRVPTNQTLETKKYVTIRLTNPGTPIYWIMNNGNNVLFDEGDESVVLDSGEYFIYSNSNLDDLVILGAGTKLTRTGSTDQWSISNTINLESLNLNGIDALTSGDWQYKQFNTDTNYLTIQETQIITLGSDTTLTISDVGSITELNGDWQNLPESATITYVYNNVNTTLPTLNLSNSEWQIRTRLDIDTGPSKPQLLVDNANKTQTLKIEYMGGQEPITIIGEPEDRYFMFNYPISIAGGQDVSLLLVDVLTGTTAYAVSINVYTQQDATTTITGGQTEVINTSGVINVALNENKTVNLPIYIEYINTSELTQSEIEVGLVNYDYTPFGTYIVPMLVSLTSGETATIKLESNCADIYEYNTGRTEELETLTPGLHMVELVAKWQGEYATLADLNAARPASITEGNVTYHPNQVEDICKVTGVGLYKWDGDSWELMPDTTPDKYALTITIVLNGESEDTDVLTIGKIHKVYNINDAINNSTVAGQDVLDKISDLLETSVNADNKPIQFYYVYTPSNSDAIEVDDILSADSLWDVNNVVNKFTIPQINLADSNIYIARTSQL